MLNEILRTIKDCFHTNNIINTQCVFWEVHHTFLEDFFVNSEKRLSTSSCLTACLSVSMYQRAFHWTVLREIWYRRLLWKSVGKLQIWLKPDENIEHFTRRPECFSCWYRHLQCNNAQKASLCMCGKAISIYCIVDSEVHTPTINRERIVVFPWQQWFKRMYHDVTLYYIAHPVQHSFDDV